MARGPARPHPGAVPSPTARRPPPRPRCAARPRARPRRGPTLPPSGSAPAWPWRAAVARSQRALPLLGAATHPRGPARGAAPLPRPWRTACLGALAARLPRPLAPPSPHDPAPPAWLAPSSRHGRPRRPTARLGARPGAWPGARPARARCVGSRRGPAACSRRAARRVRSSALACARLIHGASERPYERVLVWCARCFGTARRALGTTRSVLSRVTRSSTTRRARLPLATHLPPVYSMRNDHVIYINEMETQLRN
jgi:hypothetical protein